MKVLEDRPDAGDLSRIIAECREYIKVKVITDYIPDGATLFVSCLVCRRKLRISPEGIEVAEMPEGDNQPTWP